MADMNKLEAILRDEQNAEALRTCATREDVLAFLNSKGADVTGADMKQAAIRCAAPGNDEAMELDDMDQVAGGGAFDWLTDLLNLKPDPVVDEIFPSFPEGSPLMNTNLTLTAVNPKIAHGVVENPGEIQHLSVGGRGRKADRLTVIQKGHGAELKKKINRKYTAPCHDRLPNEKTTADEVISCHFIRCCCLIRLS